MRSFLVRVLATTISLFITSYFVAGFQIDPTWQAYLVAAIIFIVFNAIASPIIKLLLLPINLLTLGLLRWLTNVIVLYLFDLLYSGVTISSYNFTGLRTSFIALSPTHISLFWALVLSSFFISISFSLISTLFHAE